MDVDSPSNSNLNQNSKKDPSDPLSSSLILSPLSGIVQCPPNKMRRLVTENLTPSPCLGLATAPISSEGPSILPCLETGKDAIKRISSETVRLISSII